jgi:hypothetical protein
MVHKIAGEISVEQINKRNDLLRRPVEWVFHKIKQNQNGRWLVVFPREFAAPGAKLVYPTP